MLQNVMRFQLLIEKILKWVGIDRVWTTKWNAKSEWESLQKAKSHKVTKQKHIERDAMI